VSREKEDGGEGRKKNPIKKYFEDTIKITCNFLNANHIAAPPSAYLKLCVCFFLLQKYF
jgi:hypothetical protein